LTNNLRRQVKTGLKTHAGTENGLHCGNDQNTLPCNFMQKIGIKCEEKCKKNLERRASNTCSWSTI